MHFCRKLEESQKNLFTNEINDNVNARFACASSDAFQKEFQSCIQHKEAWQICSVCNDVLCAKCDNIINVLGRKWYIVNSVCFEFGDSTFDESETIKSKCIFGNYLKPGSRPAGPKQ